MANFVKKKNPFDLNIFLSHMKYGRKITKPGTAQVGAIHSSFLNMQRTLFKNFYHFLIAKKIPQRIRKGNHIFSNWKHKKSIFPKFKFFSEKSHSAEKRTFSSNNYLFSCQNQLCRKISKDLVAFQEITTLSFALGNKHGPPGKLGI